MGDLLNSTASRIATLFLLLQAALLYSSVRPEAVPPGRPLVDFPKDLGSWQFVQDGVVDQETLDVLKADDLLNRRYVEPATNRQASLFVAAFRSQRNGKAPHSPKNCLPGSGWTPLVSDQYAIDTGAAQPIQVNRYVIAHGTDRAVVLYWYQSRDRVVASEYKAKFWVMADAIRLNRTDTALARVVVDVQDGDQEAATTVAAGFVKAFFGRLREFLPA